MNVTFLLDVFACRDIVWEHMSGRESCDVLICILVGDALHCSNLLYSYGKLHLFISPQINIVGVHLDEA